MKLSGNYSLEDLVRTLQGNFSCQHFTQTSKKKPLGDDERITLELFFLRIDIFPKKNKIEVYSVSEDEYGEKNLKKLMTLTGQ